MINIEKLEALYIEGTLSEYLKMCSLKDLDRLAFMVSDSHLIYLFHQEVSEVLKQTRNFDSEKKRRY